LHRDPVAAEVVCPEAGVIDTLGPDGGFQIDPRQIAASGDSHLLLSGLELAESSEYVGIGRHGLAGGLAETREVGRHGGPCREKAARDDDGPTAITLHFWSYPLERPCLERN